MRATSSSPRRALGVRAREGLPMTHRSCFVLIGMLAVLAVAPVASAGDKEDVAAAGAQWAKVFVDDNPDPILALYAKDAVFWGTLSPTRRETPEAIREYF